MVPALKRRRRPAREPQLATRQPTCARADFCRAGNAGYNNSGIDSKSCSPQNCDESADDRAEREYGKYRGDHERTWHCSSPVFIDSDAGRGVATATRSSSSMPSMRSSYPFVETRNGRRRALASS